MRLRKCVIGILCVAANVSVLGGGLTGNASAQEAPQGQRTCRGEPATLVGSGELTGTSGRDVIVATEPRTLVLARAGDDLICGSRRVHGQQGDDEIHYSGAATSRSRFYILGGTGNDVIEFHKTQHHASSGTRDGVYGGAGADLILGAEGMLFFSGGSGPDRLVGGGSRGDLMDGGPGADVLVGGSGQDILSGGGGDDLLYGRGRSDDLSGGPGHDEVWGGPAWDICAGGNEIEHSCEADDWL
jgi:Ca2+-binding RTX toxin-like protein